VDSRRPDAAPKNGGDRGVVSSTHDVLCDADSLIRTELAKGAGKPCLLAGSLIDRNVR
jgi:hypothetical protein